MGGTSGAEQGRSNTRGRVCRNRYASWVYDDGTGKKVGAKLDFDVAGKTGTTDASHDAWFVGYSTRLVASIWLGLDAYKPMRFGISGATGPMPIWMDFMERASRTIVPGTFEAPTGVAIVDIDQDTGLLTSEECINVSSEPWAFVKGTEPVESCKRKDEKGSSFSLDLEFESISEGWRSP